LAKRIETIGLADLLGNLWALFRARNGWRDEQNTEGPKPTESLKVGH
jgi:hypothetical protein